MIRDSGLDAKILSLDELATVLSRERARGKRAVQCHGVFDLLHPGHIRHLEAARREGDLLVVTVTPDRFVNKGPGRPVFNQRLRAESLAALVSVDYVAITESPTAVDAIRKLGPAVYVKGSDYADSAADLTGKIDDERLAVEAGGGRVHFTTEITFSSSGLLNVHFDVYPEEAQAFLREFRTRYTADAVIGALKGLKDIRVLVIGDTIIDEYHYVQSMGKSPKELLVATRFLREEHFAGGILACANHVAGFCERVDVVTVLGARDSREAFIRERLKPNVTPKFFVRPDTGTAVKRRFVEQAFLNKMFEIAFLDDTELPPSLADQIASYLRGVLDQYDLVLVADYGHGFLNRDLILQLAGESRFLAVNVQTNSANTGFNLITKYPRADYVCIDEPEVRLAMHDRTSPMQDIIRRVAKDLAARRITITRGHHGSMAYEEQEGFFEVPVLSREVVDRIGAGDAYLAITAPCAAGGYPAELVGFVGNAVGALAVRIIGNRTAVEPVPLFKFITALLK
ncbi:MAG: adenylyltransferase/cytidyltransferase family protein [Candidatus Rokubacteria bacterium]|nr:adenylyltransferase/cytidyltransferase family protein [Candidatus Rokubacteria bacterium]